MSVRPPPSSRNIADDDDDDGRTVVRGAPKIVKRTKSKQASQSNAPTSISPAAVIKATLESARENRRDQLMPGPPSDLLEDRSDFSENVSHASHAHASHASSANVSHAPAPAPSARAPFVGRSYPPPGFEGPPSHAANFGPSSAPGFGPPSSNAHGGFHHHHPAPPSVPASSYPGGYHHAPTASASVPGVAMSASMPAHFNTPQYSDPPGTAITSGHRIGRPAGSWAVALLACGLLVGVVAVAVMQGSDSIKDTTASFVDPSSARPKAATQPAAPETAPVPVVAPVAPAIVAATAVTNPATLPPGLLGASPMPAPEAVAVAPVAPTAPAAVAAPVAAPVGIAFAPVPVPAKPAAAAPPAARPATAWKPPAAAPAPAPKPAKVASASSDEEPKKTSKKPSKSEPDDETKKALEALQKAQLESASSFGEK